MKNKLTNRKIFLVEAVKVKHSKTQVEFVLKKKQEEDTKDMENHSKFIILK